MGEEELPKVTTGSPDLLIQACSSSAPRPLPAPQVSETLRINADKSDRGKGPVVGDKASPSE